MPFSRAQSLIRSKKKFKITNTNKKYSIPMKQDFEIELFLYEDGKRRLTAKNGYYKGHSINYAIIDTFQTEIEKIYPMDPNKNYFVEFKVYVKKDV